MPLHRVLNFHNLVLNTARPPALALSTEPSPSFTSNNRQTRERDRVDLSTRYSPSAKVQNAPRSCRPM
jgi:hypothetical protein